jgi:cobalt/nickel transport system permease protein
MTLLPVGSFVAIGIGWLGVVAAALVARLGPFRTVRGSFIALPFMVAVLPLVFTRTGELLGTVDLGPVTLTVSGEGLREVATIVLKSWVSVQAALLLTFTTPFHDLIEGLRALRMPRIMVAIIGFMYRYLEVLTTEAGRMLRARAARSADAGTGRGGGTLRWRGRVAGNLVGSLFLRSYERSERIHGAMLARGFDGEFRYLAGPPLRPTALAAFATTLAGLAVFVVAAHLWLPRA